MSTRSDFNVEQQIYLGGQASEKHDDLKMLGLLGSYGDIYTLIKHWPEIMQIKNRRERALKIIEILGMSDFMASCTELTKLSAILGDTRKRYSMRRTEIPNQDNSSGTIGNNPET